RGQVEPAAGVDAGQLDGGELDRLVAGALADPADRPVDRGAAGQPRGRRVGVHLAEVVVAVPLELLAADAGGADRLDEPRDAARQRRLTPGQSEAQRVAQA